MTPILSPPLNYIEYAAVFLFLAFAEYMLGLRALLLKHQRIYSYISYFSLIIITIGIFGGLDYSGNILLIRALNAGNSGHLISWVAIMLVAYRFGYNDILKGLTIAGAFAAGHEIVSILISLAAGSYGAAQGVSLASGLWYYSTFFFLLGAILIAYFVYDGTSTASALFRSMLILTGYSIVVASIGAVGTLNVLGPTIYFYNLDVNLIEQLSWLMPAIVFVGLSLRKPVPDCPVQDLNTVAPAGLV